MTQAALVNSADEKLEKPVTPQEKPTEYMPAFETDELMRIAGHYVADYHPNTRDDAAQEFILGALIAKKRAKEGLPIRSYQWKCGMNQVNTLLTKQTRQQKREKVSLDQRPPDGHIYDANLYNSLPDPKAVDPKNFSDAEDLKTEIARVVDRLPRKLRFIVRERFWKNRSLKEIGQDMGYCPERVRQFMVEALDLLRDKLHDVRAQR